VKVWPVLLMPMLARTAWPDWRAGPDWRAWRAGPIWSRVWLYGAVSVVALGVTLGPALLSTREPSSGLAAYTAGWSMHNAFYAWAYSALRLALDANAAHAVIRTSLALATGVTALWIAITMRPSPMQHVRGALIVAAAVFYFSPAQFPWYGVWFLPLAALLRSWPLLLASVTLPAYYFFYPLWDGQGDGFFYWVSFIHAVPVLGWLASQSIRGPARSGLTNYNVNA
jgi:alpha-1,6-mannosyltransferase